MIEVEDIFGIWSLLEYSCIITSMRVFVQIIKNQQKNVYRYMLSSASKLG